MAKMVSVNDAKVFDFMKRLEFFEHFNDMELRQILNQHVQICVFEADEYIVRIGEKATSFFIILSGSVTINKEEIKLIQLEAGSFFGEISFLTKEPRTADVKANETSLLMKIDEPVLKTVNVQIREKIKDKIISQLIRFVKRMNAEAIKNK